MFTEHGVAPNEPALDARYYPCHFTVWSGCLYRLAAVRQIGLPNPDYVLDWGEGEYGYRVMKAGFKGFVYRSAILHHNIRGYKSVAPVTIRRGAETVTVYEFPAIRCYYSCRNMLYFVLYDSRGRRRQFLRSVYGPAKLTLGLMLHPRNHGKHIRACLRGVWHGITGNIAARY
jgi:GT2 family glycosyltransferase